MAGALQFEVTNITVIRNLSEHCAACPATTEELKTETQEQIATLSQEMLQHAMSNLLSQLTNVMLVMEII